MFLIPSRARVFIYFYTSEKLLLVCSRDSLNVVWQTKCEQRERRCCKIQTEFRHDFPIVLTSVLFWLLHILCRKNINNFLTKYPIKTAQSNQIFWSPDCLTSIGGMVFIRESKGSRWIEWNYTSHLGVRRRKNRSVSMPKLHCHTLMGWGSQAIFVHRFSFIMTEFETLPWSLFMLFLRCSRMP